MERLRLPAGRLATVFYRSEPQGLASGEVSPHSDIEKGSAEEKLPPVVVERSRRSAKASHDLLDRKGHSFAWKNITLDIKTPHGLKRLLDDVNGEQLRSVRCRKKWVNSWCRLGISWSDDSSNGCIWSWKGLVATMNIARPT